jgi:hypothetical protein
MGFARTLINEIVDRNINSNLSHAWNAPGLRRLKMEKYGIIKSSGFRKGYLEYYVE